MSYILDALKKSEEKRRHEQQGTTLLNHPSGLQNNLQKRSRYTILPYIIVPCVLLLSGFYIFTRNNTMVLPVTSPPPQNTAKVALQPSKDTAAKITEEVLPELRASSKKAAASKQQVPAEVLQPDPILAEAKALSAPTPSPAVDSPPYLSELPPAFKNSVPKFKLAGHVYSPDPTLRMILINNSIVRENDVVEKFFILDKITDRGIILRKDNTRFRIDAN